MNKQEQGTQVEDLHLMFSLSPDGVLTWKERPASHFRATQKRTSQHAAANWNSRYAGTEALACVTAFGHKTGRINDRLFYAHRVIWAMCTGMWPRYEIDHINGSPADNRIENLRDVPHKANLQNQARRKNNTSGANGVRFYKPRNAWAAYICTDGGVFRHIGYFGTQEEAVKARATANQKHGFHENHGRS